MSMKKLLVFLRCATIVCLTFSASLVVGQIAKEKPLGLPDPLYTKGMAGEWRLNKAKIDSVIAKIREALQRRNNALNDEITEVRRHAAKKWIETEFSHLHKSHTDVIGQTAKMIFPAT